VRHPRVLLAKPGLDGHDRGIKVIAMALRDAGAEVIYLGLRRTVSEIVHAAIQDDVTVIGISVLSGAHVQLAEDILQGLDAESVHIPVVVGGTIPEADVAVLRELGVAAVYPVGAGLHEVVEGVLSLASRDRVEP
jgi:methylmalonyl-CoA mutase C-terminal domain/subunit